MLCINKLQFHPPDCPKSALFKVLEGEMAKTYAGIAIFWKNSKTVG